MARTFSLNYKKSYGWLMAVAYMLFMAMTSIAQDIVVEGQVKAIEDNSTLPGVTILLKGTLTGTITDIDGNFRINAPSNAVLIFSYIGYTTIEVGLNGQNRMEILLSADTKTLDEVIVVGYGTQKRSHLTGSVSKVTNEKLDQNPVSRIDDALVGSIAGVSIQATNPTAGASPTIRVRGTGSITANSNPLIVLDGIAVSSDFLGSIDMNDVESVEVLKDAASAAIYGSRGGNGVIMITSKRGKSGAAKFSYNSYIGNKVVPFNDDIQFSPQEWADFVISKNGSLTPEMKYITKLGTVTDWQKVMFDGGLIQNHSLSARGGNENTKFSASLGYLGDQGVLLSDDYKKFNFNLNLDTKVNKVVEFGIRLNPSYTIQRNFPIGTHDAIRQSPWLPLYHDANTLQFVDTKAYPNLSIGDYASEVHFNNYVNDGVKTNISTTANGSVLAKVLETSILNNTFKTFANAYLKLNIAKNLSFKTSIGGEYANMESPAYTGTLANINGAAGTGSTLGNSIGFHIVNENIINYDKMFGNHDFNLVAGVANEYFKTKSSFIAGSGYNFDFIQTINAAGVIGSATSLETANTLLSYISRVNYAYANKYLASMSLRSDGSSKFGKDNRFGFFPAFSVGWRISEENFLKGSKLINDLKLRFSYGSTGNNSGIGDYASIGLISPSSAIFNQAIVAGYAAQNIANNKLQWEKQIETNPGIDISLMQGRIDISLDYYNRRSTNLLLNQPIPSVTGFSTALVNLGKVQNAGIELEFMSRNIVKGPFTWSTIANISKNKNTLLDFGDANGLISVIDNKRPSEWINQVGQPISSFYGYLVEKELDPKYIVNPYYPVGIKSRDVYVKDLNGDGKITTADRTILGNPYPKLNWSLTNNFRFKAIDLSFMIQGSHGAKVRNMDPQYLDNQFAANAIYTNDFPDKTLVQQRIFTDDIIMDASYYSIRNLNIGFNIPNSLGKRAGLSMARVYFSGQNLVYVMAKGYSGFNPEGIIGGVTPSPTTYGYQVGASPIYRSMSAGINLEF